MQPADLRVARTEMWELGVRRVDVLPGEYVLDGACGTGIAAIRAAQAGARVVGVDLTPALFEPGRRTAAQTGLELRWIAGDAEALPFGCHDRPGLLWAPTSHLTFVVIPLSEAELVRA